MISKKNNRKCIVCGQSYEYCNHCDSDKLKPSWYTIFHDENCHDIYNAVANILPQEGKEAAKEALDKCDLSNKENFHPNIIKSINEIYDIVDEVKEEKNEEVGNKEIKVVASSTDFKKEIEEENKKEEKKIETEAEIKSEKSDTATAKKVQGRTRNKK